VAPQSRDPGRVSDDVSLVQPYDGGSYGYSLLPKNLLQTSTVGATGFVLLLQTGENEVYRLLNAHVIGLTPTRPTRVLLNTIDRVSLNQAFLSSVHDLLALDEHSFGMNSGIVIGPNMDLRIDWVGGDGTTSLQTTCTGFMAPLGSVWYA